MFLYVSARAQPAQAVGKVVYDIDELSDEFRITGARHHIAARLKRRSAYPGTFCYRTPDGDVLLGYGPVHPQPDDEFLHVMLRANGDIFVRRDHFCTLPLFYGYDGHNFVLSNDFAAVCERLQCTVSHEGVIATLFAHLERPRTLWDEVGILGDRECVSLEAGKLIYTPAPPRTWTYSDELPATDPRQFPQVFQSRLDYFIETRLSRDIIAFEISGGLDSSILPLYAASQGNRQALMGGSLILNGAHNETQAPKLRALEQAAGLRLYKVYLDAERHHPLANVLGRERPVVPPLQELYEPGFRLLAEYFQSQGVRVVVGGVGGDDIFQHRPRPAHTTNERYARQVSPFHTAKVLEASSSPDTAATLLHQNVPAYSVSHNNVYIERDIWPVTPFHDVTLFNFCQALPVQFRANKNILRAYAQAMHFPELLYNGPNEDFESFFDSALLTDRYNQLIHTHASRSVLGRLGYIDIPLLLERYTAMRTSQPNSSMLFHIYMWLRAEMNLRSMALKAEG